jgi:F0F1-type ATP synthase membrane subunit b/b'
MSRGVSARCLRLGAAIFALAVFAAPVFAVANPQAEAGSTTGWVYRWINFLILVAALVWVFAKKTPPYFRARQKAIADAIAESARAQEEAQRQEREAEQKMSMLDNEVADLRARAKRESVGEAEHIRALAQEEAKRVAQSAQAEIRAAERAAQVELKAIAARVALERAEELLRQRINAQTESSLFNGFVAELEGAAQ